MRLTYVTSNAKLGKAWFNAKPLFKKETLICIKYHAHEGCWRFEKSGKEVPAKIELKLKKTLVMS